MLDGYRGVGKVLRTGRVKILKINRTELDKIQAAVSQSKKVISFVQASSFVERWIGFLSFPHYDRYVLHLWMQGASTVDNAPKIEDVFEEYNLEWIAVTDGGGISELHAPGGERWAYHLPAIDEGMSVHPSTIVRLTIYEYQIIFSSLCVGIACNAVQVKF